MGGKEHRRRFYIGGRCYSTEKSTLLCSYEGVFEAAALYVTPKGAFFAVEESQFDGETVRVLSEATARSFMDEHAAGIITENYDRVFGEPDEG